MNNFFTAEQITKLSAEIDEQLQELRTQSNSDIKEAMPQPNNSLPVKQSQAIAKITQEEPENFLKKFRQAAKSDLCQEGGVLNRQWQRWGDISNKDVLDKFGVCLVAMGFTAGALEILTVAVAVIVIHIGIKAFCEDYSQ